MNQSRPAAYAVRSRSLQEMRQDARDSGFGWTRRALGRVPLARDSCRTRELTSIPVRMNEQ